MRHRVFIFFLTAALISAVGSVSRAQNAVDRRATEGVLLPSPSITETRDATAIAVNPANVALLDSWSFSYVGSWLQKQKYVEGEEHLGGASGGLPDDRVLSHL